MTERLHAGKPYHDPDVPDPKAKLREWQNAKSKFGKCDAADCFHLGDVRTRGGGTYYCKAHF